MKLLNARKKTLFDGDQEELFSKEFSLKCPSCQNSLKFQPMDCKPSNNLSGPLLDKVMPSLKSVKTVNLGDTVLYKVDELALKYVDFDCTNCATKFIGLFGLGEYQPARFMFVQAALVAVD